MEFFEIDDEQHFICDAPHAKEETKNIVCGVPPLDAKGRGMRKPHWAGTWNEKIGKWVGGHWVDKEADILHEELNNNSIWKTLTPRAGWSDMVIKYRKHGGIVTIVITTSSVVGDISDYTSMGILPEGFRHSFSSLPMTTTGYGGTNGSIGTLMINEGGSIYPFQFVDAPSEIRATIQYIAES